MEPEPPPLTALSRSFFERETVEVARDLVGVWLLHQGVGGPLVETEAYTDSDDPASHAFRGPTRRNRAMFEEPGRAYVYFIYGNHFCLNVVAHPPGRAGAVLLRALEPRLGLESMVTRRGRAQLRLLASGPGRLCQALAVDLTHNGTCMLDWLGASQATTSISSGPRIGIRQAVERPWRFFHSGSPWVSRRPA
ncbi:MAG: putative 3-methyladenine DNA glycosylase [Candidatus Xenobia bacterium]